jgi:hypothetical protein
MNLLDALPAVVPTPSEYRVWVDENRVLDTLRCSPGDLRKLVDAGLICEGGSYDFYDVWNLGLFSGSGRTRPELEMIFFAKALKSSRSDWVTARRYAITGWAECPRGSGCRSPEWAAPALPDVHWSEVEVNTGRAEWRGVVELSGQSATVQDPRIRHAWDELTRCYRYQFTPERLAFDVAKTAVRKVGDCEALCRILMRDLRGFDISAELQPGYIFGASRLRRHSWLKVFDHDGLPKVLDPSMALLAEMFFTPEYKEFCYGSSLNRMVRLSRHENALAPHPCAEGADIFYNFTLQPTRPLQRRGIYDNRCS